MKTNSKKKKKYFEIEVGINRLQLANLKMWAFRNRNFCFKIEIFELQKVNSKFAQFRNDFYSFRNEVFKMFLYTVSHFEIR